MRVKVVINPAAGQPEPVLRILNDVFDAAGIDWDVALTHKTGDGVIAAREAAEEGFDLIGAYGGDGTVTEVASALAKGGPPILVLPGGTGNALADDLGIPTALADAAALASGDLGEVRRVDLGRSGDSWFVLRMTMGLEADMVAAATRELKDRYGWLAYAFAGLQALSSTPVVHYSVTVDSTTAECEGIAAIIANSAGTGVAGARIADDVLVSDGLLDVFVVTSADLPGLVGTAADAMQGRQSRLMTRWRGSEIHVESDPVVPVLADGEDGGSTPVDVAVVPGAVGVVVPKGSGGAGAA